MQSMADDDQDLNEANSSNRSPAEAAAALLLVVGIAALVLAMVSGNSRNPEPAADAGTTTATSDSPTTTAAAVSTTSRVTSTTVINEGPDPVAFIICESSGPAAVAREFGVAVSAPWEEIATGYGNEMVTPAMRPALVESCLLGFESGNW